MLDERCFRTHERDELRENVLEIIGPGVWCVGDPRRGLGGEVELKNAVDRACGFTVN